MMADIAALQHMYGANFNVNDDDTVYSWTPGSGNTRVNGSVGVAPARNLIFATIWDGGGHDTYDLSAYSTDLKLDLRPGKHSVFSQSQLADLDAFHSGRLAHGNIYNALPYRGNQASLIEDAIGGTGNDVIIGNATANTLTGGSGNDDLRGVAGNDTLIGGSGNDRLNGGVGTDSLTGGTGQDVFLFTEKSDTDTIVDFQHGSDKIDLSSFDLANFASLQAKFTQEGNDVVIDFGRGDILVIENATPSSLTSSDFLL